MTGAVPNDEHGAALHGIDGQHLLNLWNGCGDAPGEARRIENVGGGPFAGSVHPDGEDPAVAENQGLDSKSDRRRSVDEAPGPGYGVEHLGARWRGLVRATNDENS